MRNEFKESLNIRNSKPFTEVATLKIELENSVMIKRVPLGPDLLVI